MALGTVLSMRNRERLNTGWLKREFDLLVRTAKKALHDHAKDLAAAIAFWAFFSIFPLLIGIFSAAGYLLRSADLQGRIYEVVIDMFPGSEGLVRDNLDAVIQYRGTMSWVGIVGLLWTASKGFGAITRAVNRAIGAKRPHHFLLSKVRYFLMAIAVLVLAITSIGITIAFEVVLESSALVQLFELEEVEASRLKSWALSLGLIFLTFALLYKLAPYVKVSWRQVVPGALLATALFEIVRTVFVVYLDQIAHFEAIYGSLSSIIVLLLWLYLSAVILVLGAEYNFVRAKADTAAPEPAPGGSE